LQGGAADVYRKISENGVNIQLLVPRGIGNEVEEMSRYQKYTNYLDL
jgi:hypothetical protein